MHAAALGLVIVIGNWIVPLPAGQGVDTTRVAGGIGSLVLTMGAIGRPLGGHVARRAPHATRALVAGAMVAGGCATMLIAVGPPLPVVIVAAAVLGVAGGIPFRPTLHGTGRAFAAAAGRALGVVNTFAALVILVGAPLMAATFDLPGEGRLGFVVAGLLGAAVALLIPPSATFRAGADSCAEPVPAAAPGAIADAYRLKSQRVLDLRVRRQYRPEPPDRRSGDGGQRAHQPLPDELGGEGS